MLMSAKCALTSFMETRRASLGSAAPSRLRHFEELRLHKSRHTSSSRTVTQAGRGSRRGVCWFPGGRGEEGRCAGRPAVRAGGAKLLGSSASVRFPADSGGYIL